jgi:hypothetical protein
VTERRDAGAEAGIAEGDVLTHGAEAELVEAVDLELSLAGQLYVESTSRL